MKLNGFPSSSKGGIDCSVMTSIFFGNHLAGIFMGNVDRTYSKNIFWSKPLRSSVIITSFFVQHIKRIVSKCSDKKMFRINTSSIVASMKNTFSFWNWTFKNYPRYSIGLRDSFRPNLKVGSIISTSSPNPTPWSFINVSEESFQESYIHSEIVAGGY